MAIPTTREGLKQYCLRDLGAPVLEINVDDDQLEDRIDQALEFWRLYHYDGIEKLYMKQKIRASEIVIEESIAQTFDLEDVIIGQTSGAKAKVSKEYGRPSLGTLLLVRGITGEFQEGETILAGHGQSATLVSATKREYDNKYIEIDDWVYGITRVIPFAQASSSKNLFDLQYQLRLNDLYDLSSTSIVYFKTVMSHLAMLDLELNGYPLYRFNRLQSRLYLDINWETDIPLGDHIVVEAYRALNPAEFTKVWNEQWLKRYVTAHFKRQWGTNLKKFSGIQLPGGVTLDGDKLYQEAMDEIRSLEDELQNKSAPLEFFLG
jgi:hypothetical protein